MTHSVDPKRRTLPLDPKANRDTLLKLPSRIVAALGAVEEPTAREAQRFMLALAVEILTRAPMRIENLAGLRLDRHLLPDRWGRSRIWRIVIPKEEVKTGQPFDVSLRDEAAQMLEIWRDRLRPILSPHEGPYLFPGRAGGRRNVISFSRAISKFVHRETGIEMNPHLFRHWRVRLAMEDWSNDIKNTRKPLRRANTATALPINAGLETYRAFKTHDAAIERIRARANRIKPLRDRPMRRKP
jgi:hypothetical protein